MEGATTATAIMKINGGLLGRIICDRPIPKRGQVMVGIVLGLANSVVCIFIRSISCAAPSRVQLLA
ncbi:hypothetical protein MtrunA17_Chr3g0121081 [Medicago truncatula]|uniref:Transmembrane protein, putative n=1 Tax=Medicago truncatula TaxID=3880 RepID=G7J9J6_MEDTR|nr:transmembrane protein, putative [Medicago truncatula]KEH35228.1 transmembrane protein, putative [Medicago truncatula]KEH35229.1 transmembrane protein, putative [Medicago truncatula]RHN69100.1 hypothetical protein MtrunA17_Chr3g0121081 [Medicago truncatula]